MSHRALRYLSGSGTLLLLILSCSSFVHSMQVQLGTLTVTGRVKVNGQQVQSAFPIYSGAIIKTLPNSSAVVSLGKLGRIDVQPNSEVRIEFNDVRFAVAMLDFGRITVSTPAGVRANVRSADAQVNVDSNQANEFTIETACGKVTASAQSGRILLATGGNALSVKEILSGSTETVETPKANRCK